MTIGPTFGTGLFIGASQALAVGGPASLIISYLILSSVVYGLTTAVAEVAAHAPARDGILSANGYRYASRHLAFAMGYLRWYTTAIFVPFEITSAMVNLGMWEPGMKVGLRIGLFTFIICISNMLPDRPFRRSEIAFTLLKFVMTVGLLIFTIVQFNVGRGGTKGFAYWRDPGAMNEYLRPGPLGRFLGVAQCTLYSAIAFTFTPELIVHRTERKDCSPRPNILSLAQVDSVLFSVLYILSAVAMGVLCPSDDPLLTNNGRGAGLSPYVVGVRDTGIPHLAAIVTGGILLTSVSSGRTFLYVSSRTLCSLAENGHGPSLFALRNSSGVPWVAVVVSSLFAGLANLSILRSSTVVFNWLMPVLTSCGYLSWVAASLAYFDFRRATKGQRILRANRSRFQPFGAYYGLVGSLVLMLANGLDAARPTQRRTCNFVPAYIAIPVFLILYYGHRVLSPVDPPVGGREKSARNKEHWWNWLRSKPANVTVRNEASNEGQVRAETIQGA